MSIQRLILEKVEKMDERSVNILVSVAKIEEHLTTLNGRVEKTEKGLKEVKKNHNKLAIKVGGVVGIVSVVLTLVIQRFI